MFKTPVLNPIKILDEEIKIVIDHDKCTRYDADGLYEYGVITLKKVYITEEYFKQVLIHECFHALCEALGCQLDIHMEETLAHTVSRMIVKNFK